MLYLQEEGRGRVWVALGLAVLVCVVLVPCVTCLVLLIAGPAIGNVFSRIESGLDVGYQAQPLEVLLRSLVVPSQLRDWSPLE
jgi:hypothetical protein